jgi:nuclear pore complex protein Nup98-Nup96
LERHVWQLANILFNDDIEDDIPAQLRQKFIHRIKKDRLSRLWESIVREKHSQDLEKIVSPEERAVAFLTYHRVEEACKTLVESGNLHLATLLSQIGRDKTIRMDMQKQVESWRQHNVYSEMNEPIRALYELLAGNALRSEGRPSGALEDRASTFTFSERFELDWFQAFGLRLWYGITDDEPIEAAVSRFFRDLTEGDEPAFPFPPHLEAARDDLRHNQNALSRESPLWLLLKVYAVSASDGSGLPKLEFPAAVLPESVTGDRLANRLSFQLHQIITSVVGHRDSLVVDNARADQLVWDYAWELSASGQMEQALFVLLHLSRAVDRERSVKETLGRFAATLPDPLTSNGTPDAAWQYLTTELQLPEAWIWVARALYARAVGDAANEVHYLIRGKNWNEAHATFCREVGPKTIIERHYNNLQKLLSGFGEAPERRVRGWTSGGAVYEDFLRLVTAKSGHRDQACLKRLVGSLVIMGEKIKKRSGAEGLNERVAFMEMSRVVAGWCVREDNVSFRLALLTWIWTPLLSLNQAVELSAVLQLPLTGDARVMHTAEISRRYYNAVMASAH